MPKVSPTEEVATGRTGRVRRVTASISEINVVPLVDVGTWSGEDIFRVRGLPGKIWVSERFAAFCAKHQIKNALLIPTEDFAFDHYPWEVERE